MSVSLAETYSKVKRWLRCLPGSEYRTYSEKGVGDADAIVVLAVVEVFGNEFVGVEQDVGVEKPSGAHGLGCGSAAGRRDEGPSAGARGQPGDREPRGQTG